jgi:hypothetical protein
MERNKMPERIAAKDLKLPQTFDEARKIAESLALWINFIETNPLDVKDPMSSFGVHIESHLAFLEYWFKTEAIKAITETLTS